MLEKEFEYFKANNETLFASYPNKYLVIKDLKVQYAGESFEDALSYATQHFEMGSFLVQQCTKGAEGYTQTFHSRVVFA